MVAMQQLEMSGPVELLGSQAGNNGGGWCQNSQLASREEETGKQAVPGTIITSEYAGLVGALLMPAKDVSGIHSNEAGAWLAACDFGGWEWRWAGSYHSVARHKPTLARKCSNRRLHAQGNQWARNNR